MTNENKPQIIQNFISLICMALFSIIISGTAHAEGNCPSGSYPVGGQGVQGCAPIPGGGGNQGAASNRTWKVVGAIAAGTNGVVGTSFAKVFRGKIQENALEDCQKKGGTQCKLWFTYSETECATVGQAEGTTLLYGRVTGSRIRGWSRKLDGRENVYSQCQNEGFPKERCKIVYENCSGIM